MADYEVGYKKPPRHTRFKKGVCPNPKGRPRKAPLEAWRQVHDVLAEPVAYNEGNVEKAATLKELAIRGVLRRAATGDIPAIKKALTLLRHAKLDDEPHARFVFVENAPVPRDADGRAREPQDIGKLLGHKRRHRKSDKG